MAQAGKHFALQIANDSTEPYIIKESDMIIVCKNNNIIIYILILMSLK